VNVAGCDSRLKVGSGGGGGGGGGGGDKVSNCSRGGRKLGSNHAKMNLDVEDEDGDEDEDDIDQIFETRPSRPLSEEQVLSSSTISVLSTLAASCRAVISPSTATATIFNSATDVLKSLVEGHPWDSVQSSFQVNTLLAIAERCGFSDRVVESSQFIFSLNLIQYRAKIES
jgi:hypothetical protein